MACAALLASHRPRRPPPATRSGAARACCRSRTTTSPSGRGTPTGRRLALAARAMPANKDGVRIDPREWNRADGFSPGPADHGPGARPRQPARVRAQRARADHRHRAEPRPAPAGRADRRADGQAAAVLGGARRVRPVGRGARAADPAGAEPARGAPLRRRAAQLRTAGGRAIAPTFAFRALRDRRMTRLEVDRAAAAGDAADLPRAPAGRRGAREPGARLGLHGGEPPLHDRAACCTCATRRSTRSATRTCATSSRSGRRRCSP